jgi:hypothetical protein
MIFSVALFAALPASALAFRGPLPPVYSPAPAGPPVYLLHGTLSNYVPAAGLTEGSITIRVAQANAPAAFALYRTLTFRVTSATLFAFGRNGSVNDGEIGSVRLTSAAKLTTTLALQAVPAAVVIVDRAPEQNQP